MKNVIITGATGSIGISLIDKLLSDKIRITVILNPSSQRNGNIPAHPLIRKIFCDINNYDALSLSENHDTFFHLAWRGTTGSARNNIIIQKSNYEGTLNAVKLAHRSGCKKFIGIGSQAEYGNKTFPLTPQTECTPETEYGKYKLKAGIDAKKLCCDYNMEFNWIRILSVYGAVAGDSSLVCQIIKKMINKQPIEFTAAEQIWDFLYCDDAAKALLLTAEKGVNGKTYVLGSGENKSLKEYIEIIFNVCQSTSLPIFGQIPYNQNQCMYLSADITELTEDTGFVPEISFEEGTRLILNKVGKGK